MNLHSKCNYEHFSLHIKATKCMAQRNIWLSSINLYLEYNSAEHGTEIMKNISFPMRHRWKKPEITSVPLSSLIHRTMRQYPKIRIRMSCDCYPPCLNSCNKFQNHNLFPVVQCYQSTITLLWYSKVNAKTNCNLISSHFKR